MNQLTRAVGAVLAVAGCGAGASGQPASGTPGAKPFTFVAPGGQDKILYDPPESRGTVTGLSGEDLANPGATWGLADFPGQVVVLNVWGSWCGPCRAEMPDLQELQRTFGSRGVTVLGLDVRDDRDAARDFLADRSITYPNIFDQPGESLVALDGLPRYTVPSTVVLDRRHRVAAVFLRAVRLSELAPIVQRVVAEEPRPVSTRSASSRSSSSAGTG